MAARAHRAASCEHARQACTRGVRLVLTTDAHTIACLDHLEYAVATARRGWVRPEDVLNCLPVERFLGALRGRNFEGRAGG